MSGSVLEVTHLEKVYTEKRGLFRPPLTVQAVRGVTFQLDRGETICLVGESGSGKSTLGKIVADVLSPTGGTVVLEGQNLFGLTGRARDEASLAVQIIHQDPFAALNPTLTVFQSLSGPLLVHRRVGSHAQAVKRAAELLDLVGVTPAEENLQKYPHQLSGGQRQRVVIARALTVEPRVIVADEATSMVDVSMRVGILATLRHLTDQLGVAMVFITHDLGVARYAGHGQRIAVMYRGKIVEIGPTERIIQNPAHPYTVMLLSAVPLPDPVLSRRRQRLMPTTGGPENADVNSGCVFVNRCPFAVDRCREESPTLDAMEDRHQVACHRAHEVNTATKAIRHWA
jgi:oligopeptide/dipeptide ABC transporter ATP-binding protein